MYICTPSVSPITPGSAGTSTGEVDARTHRTYLHSPVTFGPWGATGPIVMEDQSKGHAVSLLFWTEPWLIIVNNFLIGFRPSIARLHPQLFYCTPERRRCRKIAVPRNTIRHTARLNLAMCLSLQSYCPFATSLLARSETSNRDR